MSEAMEMSDRNLARLMEPDAPPRPHRMPTGMTPRDTWERVKEEQGLVQLPGETVEQMDQRYARRRVTGGPQAPMISINAVSRQSRGERMSSGATTRTPGALAALPKGQTPRDMAAGPQPALGEPPVADGGTAMPASTCASTGSGTRADYERPSDLTLLDPLDG